MVISVSRVALRNSSGVFSILNLQKRPVTVAHIFPCAVQFVGFMVTWNILFSKPSGLPRQVGGDNLRHQLGVGMMLSPEVAFRLHGRFQSHRHVQVRCHSPTEQFPAHLCPWHLLFCYKRAVRVFSSAVAVETIPTNVCKSHRLC
jgi:hypothetical protein